MIKIILGNGVAMKKAFTYALSPNKQSLSAKNPGTDMIFCLRPETSKARWSEVEAPYQIDISVDLFLRSQIVWIINPNSCFLP